MKKLSPTALALTGGVLFLVDFIFSLVWGSLVVKETMRPLFHDLLAIFYPGFEWLTPGGIILGVFESFVFGLVCGYVVALLYNYFVNYFIKE